MPACTTWSPPTPSSSASRAASRSPRGRCGAAGRSSSATSRTSGSPGGAACAEGPELTTYAVGMSNGLTLDRQGRVLAAEHDGRRVTRVADDGTRTVLAEHFEGKRLNSPNDIVVKSDGSVYFTDPPYAVQPSTPGVARPPEWWKKPIAGKEQRLPRRVPDRARRRHPAPGRRLRAAQRARVLARRVRALHRRLGAQAHPGLHRPARRHAHAAAASCSTWPPTIRACPTGSRWTGRATCSARDRAGCGSAAPTARSSGASSCRSCPPISRGARTAASLFLTARTSVYRLPTKTRGALIG